MVNRQGYKALLHSCMLVTSRMLIFLSSDEVFNIFELNKLFVLVSFVLPLDINVVDFLR